MTGLTGIGNLNELQVARPLKGARNLSAGNATGTKTDGVQFSAAGQEAVEVARFVRESELANEIRQERVEAAKQNLEQGRERVEEVVNIVAEAIVGYL